MLFYRGSEELWRRPAIVRPTLPPNDEEEGPEGAAEARGGAPDGAAPEDEEECLWMKC